MSRLIRMVGQVGFGAMVVGALAFGATQALAKASRADDCQPCPYPSQQECIDCCWDELGFPNGLCTPGGSCICY